MKKLNVYFAWVFSVIFTIQVIVLPLIVELNILNCAMMIVSTVSCGVITVYFWLKIIIVELYA